MSRPARLLIALLGLWAGALAWSRASRPERTHLGHLTYGPRSAPSSVTLLDPPAPPDAADRVVRRDLFASSEDRPRAAATAVPSAPAVAATPSATPDAAPAPAFRYIGFVLDGSGRKVLLAADDGVRAVREGDTLPGGWRVDLVDEQRVRLQSVTTGVFADIPRTQ